MTSPKITPAQLAELDANRAANGTFGPSNTNQPEGALPAAAGAQAIEELYAAERVAKAATDTARAAAANATGAYLRDTFTGADTAILIRQWGDDDVVLHEVRSGDAVDWQRDASGDFDKVAADVNDILGYLNGHPEDYFDSYDPAGDENAEPDSDGEFYILTLRP